MLVEMFRLCDHTRYSDTYTNSISPLNLLGLTPPKVSSPFVASSVVVGSKETATRLSEIAPSLNKLSVKVGIVSVVSGDRVPWVRATQLGAR